jgi:hypothetical protein
MEVALPNLMAGWLGVLAGILSGGLLGLFFHRDDWMGGYGSFRRRMARLGHISFFGLGFINLLFVFSVRSFPISPLEARLASLCFMLGLVAMPACCFLTAWRKPLRHLFAIPVTGVVAGVVALLWGIAHR